MADERSVSVHVSSSSASSLPLEVARLAIASDEDVTAKRKQQRSEREATRIYLGDQHKRWRDLLQEL